MKSDIEIAQSHKLQPIRQIGNRIGLQDEDLILYGNDKAKISLSTFSRYANKPRGKLILVTAMNPTPAGEGKTTTSIGLADALCSMGKKAVLSVREPSLGPVFGRKGGAAGGGYAQVVPMEDINLHFTGDMHAITAANNLLAALIDNHIHRGNALNIDPGNILLKRCLDCNDRTLRQIVIGIGGAGNGVVRQDGFQITVASEVMAILCLSNSLEDLKERLGNMLIAFTYDGHPVYASDLKAQGSMTALLKDAICPNLVQTLEGNPALVHGGPFANIAHGCSSLLATKFAQLFGDFAITEAGFGSDLGGEKFLDITCRIGGLSPDCAVIVATARALRFHGGADEHSYAFPSSAFLRKGLLNLEKHIENMQQYHLPVVVALNRFPEDTQEEIAQVKALCEKTNCRFAVSEVFSRGGQGGVQLAQQVMQAVNEKNDLHFLYELSETLENKISKIACSIYGAKGVCYTEKARKQLKQLEDLGFSPLPVCIAKTQYSLSDSPGMLGRPTDFVITVRELFVNAGAGFVVALTGDVVTMPGLPQNPAALQIDVAHGMIQGLF